MEVLGGPRDGEVVFETVNTTGDSLAHIYEPSLELSGVERLRFSCEFDNPRDEAVGWGIGDQEMCAIGFFTNAPVKAAAAVLETDEVEEIDGTFIHTGRCGTAAFR